MPYWKQHYQTPFERSNSIQLARSLRNMVHKGRNTAPRNPAAIARATRAIRAAKAKAAAAAKAKKVSAKKSRAVKSRAVVKRAPPRAVKRSAPKKAVAARSVKRTVTVKKVATTAGGARVYRAYTPHWKFRSGGAHKWQHTKRKGPPAKPLAAPRKGCGCGKKIR